MGKGLVFSFEGGEGAGKGTQIKLLEERLKLDGYEIVTAYEPGTTVIGEVERSFLKGKFDTEVQQDYFGHIPALELLAKNHRANHALTRAFSFLTARADVYSRIVKPAVDQGKIVLLDRSADSTLAYQAHGEIPSLAPLLRECNTAIMYHLAPITKTFFLDIPVEIGLRRAAARRGDAAADWFESQNRSFHEKIRQGYLAETAYYKDPEIVGAHEPHQFDRIARINCVDGTRELTPLEIHQKVYDCIQPYLKRMS